MPSHSVVSQMARQYRFDRVELGARSPQKRADGSMRFEGPLTRTGVFTYQRADGAVQREYRSPAEVGRVESLASLELAPYTIGHPASPGLARTLAVGTVGDRIDFDGRYVKGAVVVRDEKAIETILRGDAAEVSLGYTTVYVPGPGVSPEGEAYDGLQTDILYEHAAGVPRGRAGSTVRFRTDTAGAADGWRADAAVMVECAWCPVSVTVHSASLSSVDLDRAVRDAVMSIDGVTIETPKYDAVDAVVKPGTSWEGYPPGRAAVRVSSREMSLADLTAKLKAALASIDVVVGVPDPYTTPAMPTHTDRADAAQETLIMDELKKALAEVSAQTMRADAAVAENTALKAAATAATARADRAEAERDTHKERADVAVRERNDAAAAAPAQMRARLQLEATGSRVLGADWKADGLDDVTIKRAVVERLTAKALPADKSPDYVAARFDLALELAGESLRADADLRIAVGTVDKTRADDLASIRAAAHAEARNAGNKPLNGSN